ncbi:hypothetical protein V8G54_024873 [Vigna mungo]|uniref:Uncharacterized protein n=1 Tax=Vigna mungo TaxID=3915 RepID=A0AAQ3RRQ4_VIGMU
MCIRIRLRSKFFHKLEPNTRTYWRRSNRIRLPSKLLENLDPDTPSRCEKLDPDTSLMEVVGEAGSGYACFGTPSQCSNRIPSASNRIHNLLFTSLIPPSTFGHLHPLRHHHQHCSCSSINDCLALPLNHRPSTCNNHIKNGKIDYLCSTAGHSQANTSAHRLAQSSSK